MESFIFGWLIVVFYFLPSMVAAGREHHNFKSIFVVNIFFGWTLLGWVICLAMSVSRVSREHLHELGQRNTIILH